MIRECANPDCNAEFLYAHEGQLFSYEIRNPKEPCRDVPAAICRKKPGRAVVYFWLCEQCCERFTLHFTISSGVTLISNKRNSRPSFKSLLAITLRARATP